MPSSPQQAYHEAFQRVLEQLNPAQREAVDHIEGPVLVIAGPGTGKTHILAARIGRILQETDTQAHNILCLTFTDAGVQAMRQRLLELIGPEAHRVHIYTYHSFCNSVIQDHLELFGRADLEPLSDLERVETIRELIDGLPTDHLLKGNYADLYQFEGQLQDLFQRMKAEGWSAGQVLGQIDRYLDSLPERPEYVYQINRAPHRKGDLKLAKIDAERERMEKLRAAAPLYDDYQGLLRRRGRYDYDDMILWVLSAFRQHPNLLRAYQEQYLYFLVDEYQDTNGSQNAVLHALIDYWESPNIFIVGDDDQSIYEFQGARLKNLIDFHAQFREELRLVVLTDNYRSSQTILDASRGLISHNEIRIAEHLRELGVEKVLTARREAVARLPEKPRIVEYPNPLHEETALAKAIQAWHEQGVPLEEMAVIYPRHRQAAPLMALLGKMDIPYNARRKVNLLDEPLIRQLRLLLEYLRAERRRPYSGEHLLFRLLHAPFWEILPDDLARLAAWKASRREEIYWRDLLSALPDNGGALMQTADPWRKCGAFLRDLQRAIDELSVPRLLERIFTRSGLLAYVLGHPDRNWLVQVLHSFQEFAVREADRNPRLTLTGFLGLVEKMDANRLPVELQKSVVAEQGVSLLTAHASKGLEFRIVFLLGCNQSNWEPRSRGSNFRFSFPDTLTFSGEEDALEARRRLFFVAMTRAKERLIASYAAVDRKEKPNGRTRFLDELLATGLELEQGEMPAEDLLAAQLLALQESSPPEAPALEAAVVDELLRDFSLSVSALNQYLRCPLSFFYEHILRAPTLMSPAAAYGLAIHRALQRLFERMSLSKEKTYGPVSQLLQLFEREMEQLRSYFSAQEYGHRLELGRQRLQAYYDQEARRWPKQVKVELDIRNVEADGVPLRGVLDRVDLLPDGFARVVDYKTGRPDSRKTSRPTAGKPYGGNYWRQLVFYRLLLEQYRQQQFRFREGALLYLEPGSGGKFEETILEVSQEDAALVRKWIRESYAGIQAHDFYSGCGEPNCQWCAFVRHHQPVDSLSDAEVEELDDR